MFARIVSVLLGFAFVTGAVLGAVPIPGLEEAPAGEKVEDPHASDLIIKIVTFPPQAFFGRDGAFDQRVKKLPSEPGVSPRYDVHAWFAESGMEFPAGSSAIYSPELASLTLINTVRNMDVLDAIVCDGGRFALRAEITLTLAEFAAPRDAVLPDPKAGYAEERKLFSGPWKVDGYLKFVVVSGAAARAEAVSSAVSVPAKKAVRPSGGEPSKQGEVTPFEAGESGMRAYVEPMIGPDRRTVDINLTCRYRSEAKADAAPANFYAESHVTAIDGEPVIVQISKVPQEDTVPGEEKRSHFRALVMTMKIMDLSGGFLNPEKLLKTSEEAPKPIDATPPLRSLEPPAKQ